MSQPLLSASQIFDAVDRAEDIVEVPEWGGKVRLVQMTAAESIQWTRDMHTQDGSGNGIFLVLIYSARDEANQPVFTMEDIERLKLKNFNVLNTLQRRALALNKHGIEEQAALKKD